jgi:hypothetical protein
MGPQISASDPYWQIVEQLKKALDPFGIVSPGRYSRMEEPGAETSETA